jgi:hypothetical protein
MLGCMRSGFKFRQDFSPTGEALLFVLAGTILVPPKAGLDFCTVRKIQSERRRET